MLQLLAELLRTHSNYNMNINTPKNHVVLKNMILTELTRRDIPYHCPRTMNPERVMMVELLSKRITGKIEPVFCDEQVPLYMKYGIRYYRIEEQVEFQKLTKLLSKYIKKLIILT